MDPRQAKPLGTDKDLGAGQGQRGGGKGWTREIATDAGTWCGAQSQAAESGGWQVLKMSRWTAFTAWRGGGDRVQQIEVIWRRTVTGGGRR